MMLFSCFLTNFQGVKTSWSSTSLPTFLTMDGVGLNMLVIFIYYGEL